MEEHRAAAEERLEVAAVAPGRWKERLQLAEQLAFAAGPFHEWRGGQAALGFGSCHGGRLHREDYSRTDVLDALDPYLIGEEHRAAGHVGDAIRCGGVHASAAGRLAGPPHALAHRHAWLDRVRDPGVQIHGASGVRAAHQIALGNTAGLGVGPADLELWPAFEG